MDSMNSSEKYWQLEKGQLLKELNSTEDGLTTNEAEKRLKIYGENVVGEKKQRTALHIFISQFKNWLVLILLIATVISFFLGDSIEGIVIITLVLLSVFFGFIQEYKAEKVLKDLKKYITNKCKVKRDGKWVELNNRQIVSGDIVELHIGDKVPADIRLIGVDNLMTDESVLTGESLPVEKNLDSIKESTNNPSKIKNIAFMGSTISQGTGHGVVVATGKNSFFGKSAQSLEASEPETDFQKQIRNFSTFLFRIIIIMTLFIFSSNALLKKDILESFLFALALAVGITPEMLPAIITVTLSQGAMRMAKKKVVVKKLIAVEDLGNIDSLCMDKTGTITEGIFSLDNYLDLNGKRNEDLIVKSILCTSGIGDKGITNNPVDKAIFESVYFQQNKNKISKYNLLDENEFDYNRKRMSVLVKNDKTNLLITKGAYESVDPISTHVLYEGKVVAVNKKIKSEIDMQIAEYERLNYRIIAVAEKITSKKVTNYKDESDMTLLGFLLFKDPVKQTAPEAIKKLINMGVTLRLISGDSLSITKSIAKEAGMQFSEDEVISGDDLENVDAKEFDNICKKIRIFARVTPDQKYKIVKTLNYEGHIVGFLGDGVNDVPALRVADVGISVNGGTDIAKDASDIILLEKDLKVLSEGIEAGRKTFGNITKYILNTISANYGNMFTVAASSLFLSFIPLLPSQILLNNFLSDVPLFAIATDNVDSEFLKKPKKWNLGFIKNFMIFYGFVSTFFDMLLIIPMILILKVNVDVFRTAWFVESSISEMLVTFAIRTRLPFYKSKPSTWLLSLSIISILFVIFLPFSKLRLFSFVNLPFYVWMLILFDLVAYFLVTEIVKRKFFNKFESQDS